MAINAPEKKTTPVSSQSPKSPIASNSANTNQLAQQPESKTENQPTTSPNSKEQVTDSVDLTQKPLTESNNNPAQIQSNQSSVAPMQAGTKLSNNPAFDDKLTNIPAGQTNPDGSLTTTQAGTLPNKKLGSIDLPTGSKINPDGSIEVGGDTTAKIDNFPVDIPKGSVFDSEGNLKLKDGMTIRKDGQILDAEGKLIAVGEFAIVNGKIIDLRGLSTTDREKILTDGFQYTDDKGNPLPTPPRAPSSNPIGRDYTAPYIDETANRQFNNYQNNRAPERAKAATDWQKLNPAEVFDRSQIDGDLASRLVANIKQQSTGQGRCYKAVANAVQASGIKWQLPSQYNPSAYMFAEGMRKHPESARAMGLKEVAVPKSANAIPAGAICVWNRGAGGVSAVHGHISIADGKGSQWYGVGAREFWSMPNYMFVPAAASEKEA
ncbi:MAG: hypothetical protein SFT81_06330 [Candidatus Caenarcaniphilales bacterium]|nr:hypothetical protein [Candidatus Caenarcaniphilales bacterium]